jgi:hypothetical protein
LLEVPGPWGRSGLTGSRLPAGVAGSLAAAAEAAGVRVQLIRRPGRHSGPPRRGRSTGAVRHAWALACPDDGIVRWGSWIDERELLDLDLLQSLPVRADSRSSRSLALVCTHAKHDVCCAVRGRPVAAAVEAATGRQTWETSHLGGDRFAANLLLLPEGEVFGGLDETSAVDVIRRLDAGRVTLPFYRGRVGRPQVEQAAVQLAAGALQDDTLGGVRVLLVEELDRDVGGNDRWQVRVEHSPRGCQYRLELVGWWSAPELLSCAAVAAKPARRFGLVGIQDARRRR